MFESNDFLLEEELARNPYHLKTWLRYLSNKEKASSKIRFTLYERALKHLPRSYKLWYSYLNERLKMIEKVSINNKKNEIMIHVFERALSHMNKMPKIWELYIIFIVKLKKGTFTRKIFDRALQSLPITQHDIIWSYYINWARDFGVIETAIRVFRRFLMYDPTQREDFVEYLEESEQYGEAAKQLVLCLENQQFKSNSGKTTHELWMHICDICSTHPFDVSGILNVEEIIRSGIARFSDEVGRLWCKLADYYIRLGEFDKARDIFDEAIGAIVTVRDFSVIFDAHVKFEESLLTAKMSSNDDTNDDEELSFDLARLEYLIDKRPLLLNSVMLRQNPHNVHEWQKRIKLFKDDPRQTVITYMEAIKTIEYRICSGKLSGIWLGLAHYYEKHKDIQNAREVMKKATEANYRTVDELALIWCSWIEMELRHKQYKVAIDIAMQAVRDPSGSVEYKKKSAIIDGGIKEDLNVHLRLHKNLKIWSLYLDLEESLGTVESCSCAYDRAMELKVVTPQMALNYAAYLEEKNFFENSFRVYERAIALFEWPHVKTIWITYLDQFISRYGGSKLERLRDLFEQAILKVPPENAAEICIKYAKAEEEYGLARHAMAVYDRARAVPESSKLDMYRLYIRKVEEHYGVTRTRNVYERAVAELPDDPCRELCIEFSNMERKLGEIDRARALLQHASQFSDPRKHPNYWQHWREFEEAHGNEDTFRDMLRIQRSVETAYSQVNYLAQEMLAGMEGNVKETNVSASTDVGLDAFRRAENEKENELKSSARSIVASSDIHTSKRQAVANPEEIALDDDFEDREDLIIQQKPIPVAVFGSVAAAP